MAAWDAYPEDYRSVEVKAIRSAVQAGECVSVIGLSGAGKSNLMGFLAHRAYAHSANTGQPALALVDGNRAQPRTAAGLFHLIQTAVERPGAAGSATDAFACLEAALARRMDQSYAGLCLLLDRYDALDEAERRQTSGLLRSLRDAYKYQLTYVIATRRPLDAADELSELFYANTLWLGPLSSENARWSAKQFAARRGQPWDEAAIDDLVKLSWGYPALLRACCEAYANGAALETNALRAHPAVQQRLNEFWADNPSPEALRRSNLENHPLLSSTRPPIVIEASSAGLTASEHRLLAYLQSHPGEVCAKDDLIQAIWPDERVSEGLRDDSLAQLVRRLRTKIEPDPSHPTHLLTVPGRGYRYVEGD